MELYAIKYGESVFKMKSIYQDMASSEEFTEFLWLYYLAKYNDKVLLFDTGFRNEQDAANWGVKLINVENEIKKLINGPDSVDVVFITHSHFDHIDNLDLYEKASIVIAEKEYENAVKKGLPSINKRLELGNVIKVNDEYVYDEKFCFKVIGGHTAGSSVIYFNEGSNSYVITGDECYACDNMLSVRPLGSCVDSRKNMMFLENGHQKALIPLPYHDVRIFEIYERISENIVRIL